jgi:hypothetical protein
VKIFLALAAVHALTGGLSSVIAVSAPVCAVFLCPVSDFPCIGVAGGNKTSVQAVNTVAGFYNTRENPDAGLASHSKVVDMKQITLRTHVRTVPGKGALWEHNLAMLVAKSTTLGLETLTIVPQADIARIYEAETESENGGSLHSRYFLDLKKAEKSLLKGGAA